MIGLGWIDCPMIVVTKIVFRNKLDPLTHRDRYRPFDLQHPQRYYHNRRQQNKCLGMLALFQQPANCITKEQSDEHSLQVTIAGKSI